MINLKQKSLIAGAVIVAVTTAIIWLNDSWKRSDQTKIAQGLPLNNCSAEQFVQQVKPGTEAAFKVRLDASRFWRGYQVKLGDLPAGVTGTVKQAEGRGSGEATIALKVDPGTPPADYSLMIVYEEDRGLTEPQSSICQYNLIIQ